MLGAARRGEARGCGEVVHRIGERKGNMRARQVRCLGKVNGMNTEKEVVRGRGGEKGKQI